MPNEIELFGKTLHYNALLLCTWMAFKILVSDFAFKLGAATLTTDQKWNLNLFHICSPKSLDWAGKKMHNFRKWNEEKVGEPFLYHLVHL